MRKDHPVQTAERLVPWIIIASLVAGVTGDLLLHVPVWGIGFSVWGLIVIGLNMALERAGGEAPSAETLVIGGLSALCALCLAWRDTPSLCFANVLAFLVGAGLTTLRAGRLSRAPLSLYLRGFLLHGLHAAGGMALMVVKDLPSWWRTHPSENVRLLPAVRGVLLSLPLLVVFGSLLASADAGFQYLVERVLNIDLAEIFGHLFIAGLLFWVAGGVLRGRHVSPGPAPLPPRPSSLRLGITECAVVLGALNLLFCVFVLLQIPYFFGGERTVLGTPSLTYAEYARRGFFELIGVVAVAIPLLLLMEWLTRREEGARVFRILGGTTVLLLGSIAASAVWRLWLYIERFGLTGARVNAAAVLAWLVLMLAWYCGTLLAGRRERFAFGALLAGYGVLLLLNLVNPGAIVAQTNLARAGEGVSFDARYNATLGADAVPELLAGLPGLPPAERDEVSWELLSRFGGREYTFGRAWNAGAARASALVAAKREELLTFLIPREMVALPSRAGARAGR